MSFIDAHCHLADPRFEGSLDEVLLRASQQGIHGFIGGGVDPQDWQRQLALKDKGLFPCFGLHPWFVNKAPESELDAALILLSESLDGIVGLGELGLDFSPGMNKQRFSLQERLFEAQLDLALSADLPLVLHLVASHGRALAILQGRRQSLRGIVHGFTGSREVASQYIDLGLSISVGGAVARDGYKKLKNAVRYVPNARLVVESDAPDMAPAHYSRPQNEPESLFLVAQALGELRGQAPLELLRQSAINLRGIFQLECLS